MLVAWERKSWKVEVQVQVGWELKLTVAKLQPSHLEVAAVLAAST